MVPRTACHVPLGALDVQDPRTPSVWCVRLGHVSQPPPVVVFRGEGYAVP